VPEAAAKTERHVTQALEAGAAVVAGGTRSPQHGSELFLEAEGRPPASL
jgi:acyl-CoA reductase-like NAD-dependent aldehyde dehydrogenase